MNHLEGVRASKVRPNKAVTGHRTPWKLMKTRLIIFLLLPLSFGPICYAQSGGITLRSSNLKNLSLVLDGLFFETASGRVAVPISNTIISTKSRPIEVETAGHRISVTIETVGRSFNLLLRAQPDSDITKWGLSIDSIANEYYTGLMERVVDGPQAKSWAPGIQQAMNLRGQKVDMILKPTTSIYAPYYLSSRGYAAFVKGNWPGYFEFAVSDPHRVKIEFEGPSFEMTLYTARTPAELVRTHAMDAGPPFMPPKWLFTPWRWRDEHTQRATYYDGTPVTGPFNSEIMEDVLMM
jgi:hypothetical protein